MAYIREIEQLERRWKENQQGTSFAPFAEALRKAGHVERAQEVLRQGLANHPNHIPGNIVLGRCCLDLNQDGAAEAAFVHALELDRENVIALKALADITERQSRIAEAEQWLRQLIAVDPSNDEAREQLARVEAIQNEAGAAVLAQVGPPPIQTQMLEPETEPTPLAVAEAPEAETTVVVSPADREPVRSFESPPLVAEELPTARPLRLDEIETYPIMPAFDPSQVGAQQLVVPEAALPPRIESSAVVGIESAEFDAAASSGIAAVPLSDIVREEEEKIVMPPLASVGGSEYQEPDSAAEIANEPVELIDIGVERAEEIVLRASGQSEFQTPNDAEDLIGRGAAPMPPPAAEAAPPPVRDALPAEDVTVPPFRPSKDLPLIFPEEVESDAAPAASTPPVSAAPPVQAAEPEVSQPVVGEPEPVVTETMADLYERQGHLEEALRVYRELGNRDPGNARFREKISVLQSMSQHPGDAVTTRWPSFSANVTGGESVESFFRVLLSERLGPVSPGGAPSPDHHAERAASPVGDSGNGTDDLGPGAPTRPAHDHLSLSAIFGEEAAALAPPAVPTSSEHASTPAGAPFGGGFSFDEFFGGKPGAGRAESASEGRGARPSGLEEDLDQFQNWLKGLKR